ncbi:mitochondrial glycoprotein [Pilobolus umbonatus]|nr:mitochondrial glycoprotein [Pilobolus umbonatus]
MASHLLRQSLRVLARPSLIRSMPVMARQLPVMTAFRPFSVATPVMGAVDAELNAKLTEELQYEKEEEETEQPDFIKDFVSSSSFKIEDKAGVDEVVLTRTFGNEKIRVIFSISDINNAATDDLLPEDGLGAAIEEEEEEDAPSFPVRASVTIEKEGQGAVTVDTVAQDGEIAVESVMYYKDGKLADEQSAEADWQRRGLYMGPQFSELDENLQVLIERYLEERGIHSGLANFLPDYVEYKEQKEYVRWLENMKNFVNA